MSSKLLSTAASLLLVGLAYGAPVADNTPLIPGAAEFESLINMTPTGAECMLVGNPTLYPLGLRVGIYLQWFATIFANYFVPTVARDMRGTNTLIQLGVFFGTCYASTNLPELDGLEAFILLTFCIGSITALTTSPNMDIKITRVGSIARLSIFVAIFIYGAWFWFYGVDMMAKTNCTQDIQFIFFWRVNLYHWFMKFSQALMIIGSITFSGFVLWELFSLSTIFRIKGAKWTFTEIVNGELKKDALFGGILQQEKYAWLSGALLVIMLVVMAAVCTTIEGALKYSNAILVWELNSVVELIPFVIGLFSMIKVIFGMTCGTLNVFYGARAENTEESKEMEAMGRPPTGESSA